ncbi:NAD(P)H-binding protein [Dactylosporangium sp. CS-033363]|uniref:NAD(P)H-binding protein n=1 Tax=Dactylosporangium sp. CS-033363 TaxID=3239935 RepID=UPI003D8F0576
MTVAGTVAVAGATGIVGRGYLEHVAGGGTRVLALGRRAPIAAPNIAHRPVDLTRPEQVRALAPHLAGVDRLVYAAVADDADVVAGWGTEAHVERNRAMLAGLLDVLAAAAPGLRHVVVLQGTKAYGTTLGRFRLPARESDPRPALTNFYWAQEDLLRARQPGSGWTWTILRPTAVVGVAERCNINILGSAAVYAAVSRELGRDLHFPGTNEHEVWQLVDNHLVGEVVDWALSRPDPGNEIFNVSNGDASNWESLWPVVAAHFGMAVGPARPQRLAETMPGHADLWRAMAARHGLANPVMADLVSWPVFDGHVRRDHNAYVSTLKLRAHGFGGFRDSLDTFAAKLRAMAGARLIPSGG